MKVSLLTWNEKDNLSQVFPSNNVFTIRRWSQTKKLMRRFLPGSAVRGTIMGLPPTIGPAIVPTAKITTVKKVIKRINFIVVAIKKNTQKSLYLKIKVDKC